MGYFANSTEGDLYETEFCATCAHMHPEHGCPCLEAHKLWNYEECNKDDSILHKMIPREGVVNKPCVFHTKSTGVGSALNEDVLLDRWAKMVDSARASHGRV